MTGAGHTWPNQPSASSASFYGLTVDEVHQSVTARLDGVFNLGDGDWPQKSSYCLTLTASQAAAFRKWPPPAA